jgi:hypothetical protein
MRLGLHEGVDDYQVETGFIEGRETVGAAIGDRHPNAVLLPPGAKSQADLGVVVDNQDTAHNGLLAAPRSRYVLMALIF